MRSNGPSSGVTVNLAFNGVPNTGSCSWRPSARPTTRSCLRLLAFRPIDGEALRSRKDQDVVKGRVAMKTCAQHRFVQAASTGASDDKLVPVFARLLTATRPFPVSPCSSKRNASPSIGVSEPSNGVFSKGSCKQPRSARPTTNSFRVLMVDLTQRFAF